MRYTSHLGIALWIWLAAQSTAAGNEPPRIRVADDQRGFVLADSGEAFRVWGVNYDHDRDGRLIEDYWHSEWESVEQDFAEMRELGASVVRIHLQFSRFMQAADQPRPAELAQLRRLLELAERNRLYLKLTGLGCYHKADVPPWYDPLNESDRWAAQARFWEAVAATCADSSAVFCYDLMNEPVVPGRGQRDDWLGPPFADKHFVQFITLDLAERDRAEVARQWIATLAAAIRRHDTQTLITVGLVPWSLDRPGLTSGFVPQRIADQLDFVSVHLYPERGKLDEARETLRGFQVGKPLVVEETFPLRCSMAELAELIESSPEVAGWVGFYWGQTADECRAAKTIAGAITAGWLEYFARGAPK